MPNNVFPSSKKIWRKGTRLGRRRPSAGRLAGGTLRRPPKSCMATVSFRIAFSGPGQPRGTSKPSEKVGGRRPRLFGWLENSPGPSSSRKRQIYSQIQNHRGHLKGPRGPVKGLPPLNHPVKTFKGSRGLRKGPRGPSKGPWGPLKGPRGPLKGPRGPLKGPGSFFKKPLGFF